MKIQEILASAVLALGILSAPTTALAQSAMPQSRTWNFKEIIADGEYSAPPFLNIVQGRGGLVYVSDSVGVLEFDGIRWRRLPLPDARVVTALGITDDGEIIVGASESLLAVSGEGHAVRIKDLKSEVPGGLTGIGEIWDFASGKNQWCVRSAPKLLCKDARGMFVVPAEKRFGRLFSVHGELYVREHHSGLKHVSRRGLTRVEGGELYADNPLAALIPHGDRGLVGISSDPLQTATWADPDHVPIIRMVGGAELSNRDPGVPRAVPSGGVGFPFMNGDLLIFGETWKEVARFSANQFGALPGAQAINVDHEGGIWVAWSNAITRIDWPQRVSLFQESQGLYEAPYGIFENDLGIIVHTSASFSLLRNHGGKAVFEQMKPGFPRVISAVSLGDDFLVLTIDGVWSSRGQPLVLQKRAVLYHFATPAHPNEVLLGLQSGIALIRKVGSNWIESGVRDDVSFDVLGIVRDSAGTIWLSSNVGRVARVVQDPHSDALTDARITEFDAQDGVPPGGVALKLIGGEMHIGSRKGFFHFSNGRFEPSARLPFEQTGPVSQFLALNTSELLVASPSGRLRLLSRGLTGVYVHQESVFDGVAALGAVYEVIADKTGIVWLATDSGVVRIDPSASPFAPKALQILIREISSDERTFYSGYGVLPALKLAEGDNLRFAFALPSYRAPELNSYRSRIRDIDGEGPWSKWSNEGWRDFTNLPAGSLVFQVEARDATGVLGGTVSVPIEVVAPWYRRTSTIVAFWLAGLALVVVAVQWRVRALRERSVELERLVATKTEALEHAAATDPLTGLWNRHRFGQWVRDEVPAIVEKAAHARSSDPVDVIVCGIDLDRFKAINDQHGHAAGDAVLKAFALRLLELKREDDLIFRFGGEEFVYIGMHRHRDEGEKLAESIVEALRQTMVEVESDVLLDPTASVGWSIYPFYRERGELFSMDFVLGVADRALYMAKNNGRNCAFGYLPNLAVDEIDRTQAEWRVHVFNRHPNFLKPVWAGGGERADQDFATVQQPLEREPRRRRSTDSTPAAPHSRNEDILPQ